MIQVKFSWYLYLFDMQKIVKCRLPIFYELKVNNCSNRIVKKEYKYFITEPVYWIPVAQNIYFEY